MNCGFLYLVSCVMIDHYVAFLSFRRCRGVTDWYQSHVSIMGPMDYGPTTLLLRRPRAMARFKAHNMMLEAQKTTIETHQYRMKWQCQDVDDRATRHDMRI
ncbi:hypothetical protein Tco_0316535 [Tanacetum coccineum]